jgi:hypothetical protein
MSSEIYSCFEMSSFAHQIKVQKNKGLLHIRIFIIVLSVGVK